MRSLEETLPAGGRLPGVFWSRRSARRCQVYTACTLQRSAPQVLEVTKVIFTMACSDGICMPFAALRSAHLAIVSLVCDTGYHAVLVYKDRRLGGMTVRSEP